MASAPNDAKEGSGVGQAPSTPKGSPRRGEESSGAAPEQEDPTNFMPKPHEDSGGGSEQFLQEGGDNSVQESGEEADVSEFEQAALALHGFLDARAQGQWAAACTYLAAGVVGSIEQAAARLNEGSESCAAGLEAMTRAAALGELRKEAAEADIGSVRVDGEAGYVIYRVGRTVYAVPIALEGGEWRVAALGAYPLL